ncbi:MAG: acetylornithine transaminase [Alphaproteobacteria bacterium]|jgi:acetylornithine/N-succinyldiaminopimelate aminotransferase|nr:acetylornithine transaminase [Alphaproteobacteria bacterium]PPR14685.1 MAG: Acetylornithine aminotransferase [Alphaproteobacteria bacterium MarineAlpha12_Bin1]|tara:strand:- start:18977 stop:20158 length:1182 start_codon:yes stop_codon:yes gene_type:complete
MNAVMQTYGRIPISFERGEGAYLISTDGRRYLDGAGGIAVVSMGHNHPRLTSALIEQVQKLWHVSNLYEIPEQSQYAEKLAEASFADAVFFCNSGAEAMEGAIKIARKFHSVNGASNRYRSITLEGSFHGRTLATLGAANNPNHLEGFGPPAKGFDVVPPNSLEAVREAIGQDTGAIVVEPIQGEGGIRPLKLDYLKGLRDLADEHNILLVVDEVQTGFGRTGKLFAHEWAEITPDIMACAKGIASGFPCGAVLASKKVAEAMTPGTHGSTFGGNQLAMAAANATLDILLGNGFFSKLQQVSELLWAGLQSIADAHPEIVGDIRGQGLMIGVVIRSPFVNSELGNFARNHGLLTVVAGENVLRLLPPLIIGEEEVDFIINSLKQACNDLLSNV